MRRRRRRRHRRRLQRRLRPRRQRRPGRRLLQLQPAAAEQAEDAVVPTVVASRLAGTAGHTSARGPRRVRDQRFHDRRTGVLVPDAARPRPHAPQLRPTAVAATILFAARAPAATVARTAVTTAPVHPATDTSAVLDAQAASAAHDNSAAAAATTAGATTPDCHRRLAGHTGILAMGRPAPPPSSPPTPPTDRAAVAAAAHRVQAGKERLVQDQWPECVLCVR